MLALIELELTVPGISGISDKINGIHGLADSWILAEIESCQPDGVDISRLLVSLLCPSIKLCRALDCGIEGWQLFAEQTFDRVLLYFLLGFAVADHWCTLIFCHDIWAQY